MGEECQCIVMYLYSLIRGFINIITIIKGLGVRGYYIDENKQARVKIESLWYYWQVYLGVPGFHVNSVNIIEKYLNFKNHQGCANGGGLSE